MLNFGMLRIFIDDESSCDIMYAKLFEKLGLKRESLSIYRGSDKQSFNDTIAHPYGYIEVIVTVG